jgi:hypothetical protein
VLAEYCLRLEVDDIESWLELFTEDCEYLIFRRTLRGRDEIRAMLSKAPPGIHLAGYPRVVLAGDEATTVQSYIFVDRTSRDVLTGWYHAQLVRSADDWQIRQFQVRLDR